MGVSKKHTLVLFALGLYLKEANRRFTDNPLEVSVSKVHFIDVMKRGRIIEKSERALYKNLETLERYNLLSYGHSALSLTKRGLRLFDKLSRETEPFIAVKETVRQGLPTTSKKAQTVFKQ